MHRRAAISFLATSVAGCLDRSRGTPGDGSTPTGGGSHTTETSSPDAETKPPDSDRPTVAYEDLSDAGKNVVDLAQRRTGFRLHWLREGGQRVYLEYDHTQDGWIRAENPLFDLDESLVDVFEGEAYLELDDQYYDIRAKIMGHGPYASTFETEDADHCEEFIDDMAVSSAARAALDIVTARGEVLVTTHEYRHLHEYDVVFADRQERDEFAELVTDGTCVDRDGGMQLVYADEYIKHDATYSLVSIDN